MAQISMVGNIKVASRVCFHSTPVPALVYKQSFYLVRRALPQVWITTAHM